MIKHSTIDYVKFDEIDPEELIPLLNRQKLRAHLIDHALFDRAMVESWIAGKNATDATCGCKVRAVLVNAQLAGWCGIQFEEGNYEMAIVLDERQWGVGIRIFQDMLLWAKGFNHKTVVIHLLHTRPDYKFLRKLATNVYQTKLHGSRFTTYEIDVNKCCRKFTALCQ